MNLRKRVETQRVEIKKLSEQLERHKAYIAELEPFIEGILFDMSEYGREHEIEYQAIKHTS